MAAPRTVVSVRVAGEPVNPIDEQMGFSRPPRTYRATWIRLELTIVDGNERVSWRKSVGTIVKKDGTLGVATCETDYHWAPDVETQRQFIEIARAAICSAADSVGAS